MPIDDLPLHREPDRPAPGPQRTGSSATRWLIVGAAVVIVASLLSLWWMGRAQPPAVELPPVAASETSSPSRRPQQQPMELPSLAESDGMLRELVASLSRNPMLARFLATRGLVRSVTLAIVQIGDGRTPAQPLAVLRPPTRLETAGPSGGQIAPASFMRWDTAVRALQSVPARDAAQVYVNVKPLFDEAYRELGYPDGDFDDAIERAIRMLQATPARSGDFSLLRRDGYFEHEDATLRSLPPVQKQLLLMGPEHRTSILAWLAEVAATLELDIAS